MKRLASEIIRDLEIRIANLEKQSKSGLLKVDKTSHGDAILKHIDDLIKEIDGMDSGTKLDRSTLKQVITILKGNVEKSLQKAESELMGAILKMQRSK